MEAECKSVHDPFYCHHQRGNCSGHFMSMKPEMIGAKAEDRRVLFPGPIVVGAGPSGLAVAACLKDKGIPSLILERSNCIASLWQLRTYDRLRLHLPKRFCELPLLPFPSWFPTYPTKQQFVAYLEAYVRQFDIQPVFNASVVAAEYDAAAGFWRVRTVSSGGGSEKERTEYVCRWVVVATGENAEAVLPEIAGMEEFKGPVVHTSLYRSGDVYRNKRVLVVGCGNSGMEVSLDLCNHNAHPSLVVRDSGTAHLRSPSDRFVALLYVVQVHILPREMLGRSTFELSMWLLKWLSVKTVDRFLLLVARLVLGDTSKFGLRRPQVGPLELKSLSGKTPVLDVGTLAKIKSGDIKVRRVGHTPPRSIDKVLPCLLSLHLILWNSGAPCRKADHGTWSRICRWHSGRIRRGNLGNRLPEQRTSLATSTHPSCSIYSEREFFSEKDGLPRRPFPNGWKGRNGLYAVGFTKRGLLGASLDALRIAQDIELCCKTDESCS
ncbi:hypothetical protein BHM03_00000905 [Ensete ventricosum]|nr:hypothetical protein BHM03_00000905 [Ensete ventricosum]